MTKSFLTRAKPFGGSLGIIIPFEYREILDLSEGDVLEVSIQKSGEFNEAAIER